MHYTHIGRIAHIAADEGGSDEGGSDTLPAGLQAEGSRAG